MKIKVSNFDKPMVWVNRPYYLNADNIIDAPFDDVRQKIALNGMVEETYEYTETIPFNSQSKNKLLLETKNSSSNGFGYSGQEMLVALNKITDLYSTQSEGDYDIHSEVLAIGKKILDPADCVGMVYDVPMRTRRTSVPTEIAGFITTFETTRLAPDMVENINSYNFAMVNAKFMLDTMKDSGVTIPVYYVPLGVRSDIFTYFDRPIKEEFTFGHFGALSISKRKGTDLVVEAFQRTFPQNIYPKVKLHIKTSTKEIDFKDFWNTFPYDGRIKIEHGQTPRSGLIERMHNWDCGVFPSLGEGFGLCVHPDTEIYTLNDSIKISEIQSGDKVLTEDGTFRKVRLVTKKEEKELYEIKARDNTVLVTKEHPFFASVNCRGAKVQNLDWINVTKLKRRNFIAIPIPKLDRPLPEQIDLTTIVKGSCHDDRFIWYKFGFSGSNKTFSYKTLSNATGETKKVIENAIKCIKESKIPTSKRVEGVFYQLKEMRYEAAMPNKVSRFIKMDDSFLNMLGWYLAEGSYSKGNVEFSMGVKDKVHIGTLEEWLSKYGFRYKIRITGNKMRLCISSRILGILCSHYCGSGARDKKINPDLMQSATYCSALLKAYILGDGHVCERHIQISTTSKQLAYQTKLLGLSLGFYLTTRFSSKKNSRGCYEIVVNGKDALELGKKIGIGVPNSKKRTGSSIIKKDGYLLLPIKSIKKVSHNGLVYDIAVESVHSFVGNGLLLHNTNVECMATGLPVIATGWSAMPDYIKDRETGLLTNYKLVNANWYGPDRDQLGLGAEPDINHLCELMLWVYEHRDEAKRIGKMASKDVARNWTWDHTARAIIKAKDDYLKHYYHGTN